MCYIEVGSLRSTTNTVTLKERMIEHTVGRTRCYQPKVVMSFPLLTSGQRLMQNKGHAIGVIVFLCTLIKDLTGAAVSMLCEHTHTHTLLF